MNTFKVLSLCLILLSCPAEDCNGPTGPPPPTTTTVVPEPPRVDQWFSWDNFYGFSAFAALRLEEEEIRALYRQAMAFGWNTARVCAETEFWDGSDDYPRIPRDLSVLRGFLSTVATIPNAQVLLMSNCTLKHGGLGWEMQRTWNRKVAREAADFRNIAIEVVNEPWHFRHFFHGKWGSVRQLIREAQTEGVVHVGADDHICRDQALRHELISAVTFPSFHPCRNIKDEPWDPGKGYLERLVDENGGMAVLSETVAWDDNGDQCDHFLRTCSQIRIQSYINRCNKVAGCKFVFHSEDGLAARIPYSWFPLAR